ncbi:MAG TPA: restriction endonuclease subunit S [Microthrixaceae bacterium]|nr:restriction endonuclease subunit S [Microthrixaceae bacterium]
MGSPWPMEAFGTMYAEPSRNGLMAPSRVRGTGVKLVNMREIFAFEFIGDQDMELAPIPEKNRESWILRGGDLLFARQSLVRSGAGKCVLVQGSESERTFESHIIRVRLDEKVADPEFFYYYFLSHLGRENMDSIIEQVAAAGIRSSDLAKLRVPVPPVDEQRRVAATLGRLDALIEVNEGLAKDLRTTAAEVFNSGRASRSVTFDQIAHLVSDRVQVKDINGTEKYLGLDAFHTDGGGIAQVGSSGSLASSQLKFESGDCLFGKLRPYFRKFDRPGFSGICSPEIWVLRADRSAATSAFIYSVIASTRFTDAVNEGSGGTRMPRADWAHVKSLRLEIPSFDEIQRLEKLAEPLWSAHWALQEENEHLRTTRDELLPLLIGGAVSIAEVAA